MKDDAQGSGSEIAEHLRTLMDQILEHQEKQERAVQAVARSAEGLTGLPEVIARDSAVAVRSAQAEVTAQQQAIAEKLAQQQAGLKKLIRFWLVMVLGAFVLGVVLSLSVASYLPERVEHWIVTHVMSADAYTAGRRLMEVGNPKAWRVQLESRYLVRENKEVINACMEQAGAAKEALPCTIQVGPALFGGV